MPRPPRRPLNLHVSALSDAEYSAYTASLAEITSPMPDVDWEDLTMGVREARGWIKGRYGVDGHIMDQILRYFCPELAQQDTLTGGQFFAVLRLVSHAQHGASIDETLVFVQANPESPPSSPERSIRTPSSKTVPPPPPPRPSPEMPTTLPPRTAPPVPSSNPFSRPKSNPACVRPRPESQPGPSNTEKFAHDPPHSSNPFLRAQSNPLPPPSSTSSSSSSPRQYASPPLPPRKAPTLLPPPRHASLSNPSTTPHLLPPPVSAPPLKPPKPPQATSPLIRQSLQAAKGAQSKKEAMDELKRTRKLEVIKKSGSSATALVEQHVNGGGSGSASGGSRNGVVARAPSPPESFYDVAAARIGRASPSTSSSSSSSIGLYLRQPDNSALHITLDPGTPSSPALPASPSIPGANPRRTRSLHQPRTSDGPLPPTPPPRRRPESAQVSSLSRTVPHPHVDGNDTHLSRHLSLSDSSSGVIETLHRALEGLRPGAGFESARVRAEGRVWPGGYVKGLKGDGERLVGKDESGDGDGSGFGQDGGTEMADEVRMGEGWRPLG